ncbi:MAG TPA: hypothetical protein VFU15_11310 [Bacteroidia bacterium]|nr:hypothetical protein [Bacteroidia bacterium]
MNTVMLDFRVDGNELIVEYDQRTEKCLWSIFNLGGIELRNGLLKGDAPHHISLERLSPDIYHLCIIDGDQLVNSKFRIR